MVRLPDSRAGRYFTKPEEEADFVIVGAEGYSVGTPGIDQGGLQQQIDIVVDGLSRDMDGRRQAREAGDQPGVCRPPEDN
jgi:hypothetical protein